MQQIKKAILILLKEDKWFKKELKKLLEIDDIEEKLDRYRMM